MIDQKTQEELRAKYNPEGSDLRLLQLRLLEMLNFIDKICKDYDIKYWLSSGSCLGAIRHGGFIPWDDDLDIEMLQEDYVKFEKVFKESENYSLQTYKNELFYTQPFSKLRDKHSFFQEGRDNKISRLYNQTGAFIDIFIMENTPYWAAESCHIVLGCLRHLSFRCRRNSLSKLIFWPLKTMAFGYTSFIKWLFANSNGEILRHTCGTGCHKNIRKMSEIFPIRLMSFEGQQYPVPGNYHSYLSRMYGNYNIIPQNIHTHTSHFEIFK